MKRIRIEKTFLSVFICVHLWLTGLVAMVALAQTAPINFSRSSFTST